MKILLTKNKEVYKKGLIGLKFTISNEHHETIYTIVDCKWNDRVGVTWNNGSDDITYKIDELIENMKNWESRITR